MSGYFWDTVEDPGSSQTNLVTDKGYRTTDTGYGTGDTGHRTGDTGYRTEGAGYSPDDTRLPYFQDTEKETKIPSDTAGRDIVGSDTVGSDTVGSDTVGSDTVGSDTVGSDTLPRNTLDGDTVGGDIVVVKKRSEGTVEVYPKYDTYDYDVDTEPDQCIR